MRTLLPLLALVAGCTAIKSTVHLTEAETAVREAEARNAQALATYEYTMALRYLEKAREEAGHAEFGISAALSKKSMHWADKAIIAVEGGRRVAVPDTLSDAPPVHLPAAPTPSAPSAPAEPAEPRPGDEFQDTLWDAP